MCRPMKGDFPHLGRSKTSGVLTGLGNLDRADAFKDVHAGNLQRLGTELRVLCGARRPGEPRSGTQMRESLL